MTSPQPLLDAFIDRRGDDIVELRRHLHRHPEVSGDELATSQLLAERLTALGLAVRLGPGNRGVVADLCTAEMLTSDAPAIFALRGDIDALRIHDEKNVDYASQNDGVMHACGHDAHTAMVFGAVLALAEMQSQNQLPIGFRLRAIFQPSEETCEGAIRMIQSGALDGVGAIVAAHVDPTRRLGTIGVRPGIMTAYCDHFCITVRGSGGHAARPHESRDPIAAAAQLVQSLYAQVPRTVDSQSAVVFTIGQIAGGNSANVIPDNVSLQGTLRTLDPSVREQVKKTIHQLASAAGAGTETTIQVTFTGGADAVVNDAALTDLISHSASELPKQSVTVEHMEQPSMGGEDFAFYGAHTSAAMFRLGCVSDTWGGAGLHTATFDLDERALAIGAKIMARTAIAWCDSHSRENIESAN